MVRTGTFAILDSITGICSIETKPLNFFKGWYKSGSYQSIRSNPKSVLKWPSLTPCYTVAYERNVRVAYEICIRWYTLGVS